MQRLVYFSIAVAGLAVGVAAYYGLTFTPIEAFTLTIVCVGLAALVMERVLRRRAEARFERAIEDISRLLSTYAQAGQALGERLTTLTEENAGERLKALEADVSVLGTVVRQVAEAMTDLEAGKKRKPKEIPAPKIAPVAGAAPPAAANDPKAPEVSLEPAPELVISLEALEQAIEEERLAFHGRPILTLPQRKTHGHDLVPRLELEGGGFAEAANFMPGEGGEAVVRRICWLGLEEAVAMARRASGNASSLFYVPVFRPLLADAGLIEKTLALFDANRSAIRSIVLTVAEADWKALPGSERAALAAFVGKGVRLSLSEARSLRLDFAALAAEGVRTVRVDAENFIGAPESFSDIHTADIADFLKRFEVDLIATGIHTEDQILTLLEDGVGLATGPHIAAVGPTRTGVVAAPPTTRKMSHRAAQA
ncbi:MAG TPA: EAL domain-containing protein [Devosiaceae bacterium]|nr:EAL domain-containing protein [Devosiaceae bacterium]